MNLIFIAPPAAGKGTISEMLNNKYGMVNISMGQLLRDIDPTTPLGQKVRKIQEEGTLVSDDIVMDLLEKRLSQDDVKAGFILDGFPRCIEQAYLLDEYVIKNGINIDYAVYLDVSFDVAKKRILGRQTCPDCKAIYNRLTGFNTPKIENICDVCGQTLVSRNDDNEESLKKRFDLFNNETYKVVEHYKSKGKLVTIDSNDNDALKKLETLEKKIGLYEEKNEQRIKMYVRSR